MSSLTNILPENLFEENDIPETVNILCHRVVIIFLNVIASISHLDKPAAFSKEQVPINGPYIMSVIGPEVITPQGAKYLYKQVG